MRKLLDFRSRSLTPWIKGGSWSVEPEGDDRGRPLFRGVSLPERPWSWYDPMQEAKTAYLDCARLGEDLLMNSSSEGGNGIHRLVLDFVNKYGPIYISQRGTLNGSPDGIPLVPREGITFSLAEATAHAELLALALHCYQAIEDPRELDSAFAATLDSKEMGMIVHMFDQALPATWGSPPYSADINLSQRDSLEVCLYALLNHSGMKGISPGIYFVQSGWWDNAYQYDSLASAMWLQLHQAVLQSVPIRNCDGCNVLFEGKSNQFYCNAICRGRANARRTYSRRVRTL